MMIGNLKIEEDWKLMTRIAVLTLKILMRMNEIVLLWRLRIQESELRERKHPVYPKLPKQLQERVLRIIAVEMSQALLERVGTVKRKWLMDRWHADGKCTA